MAFKLNRSSKEPMSEINVTPFVDVMLVLLIIFMVTAPLLTVGVQVDLPESAADSLPDDQEPLTVSINSKGEIYIQEIQVNAQKFIPKLLAIVAPGIAEALFATALGLLAAIPAVVAYNKFNSDTQRYFSKIENFSKRFLSII
jgi:biopolymer transport protein ExbD